MLAKIKHIEIDGKHYITRELAVGEVLQEGDFVDVFGGTRMYSAGTVAGQAVHESTSSFLPAGHYFRPLHPKEVVEMVLKQRDVSETHLATIQNLSSELRAALKSRDSWKTQHDLVRFQADSTIADKNATIRRLREKLENAEPAFNEVQKLQDECHRLYHWKKAVLDTIAKFS